MPDFTLELALGADSGRRVVGVDEAGRGPLAGPVTAAAVWLDPAALPAGLVATIDDSKRLSAAQRGEVSGALLRLAQESAGRALQFGLGWASVAEIDALNILQASLLAMRRAVSALPQLPDAALVDGKQAPQLDCPCRTVIGGDGTCLTIAAASILAKVARDRHMTGLAARHPGYGWEHNYGYGTAAHQDALRCLGVTGEHRRSFRPVREVIELTF